MTTPSIQRRTARADRRETPMHLFTIGQAVRLRGGFRTFPKTSEVYRITGMLPPREDSPQYRIRNDDERHERVTTQDNLRTGPTLAIQRRRELSSKGRSAMAKGQKRSNREIRKPKQEKASPKPESTFGKQLKLAANTNASHGSGKS